jgi:hypothetical protein
MAAGFLQPLAQTVLKAGVRRPSAGAGRSRDPARWSI